MEVDTLRCTWEMLDYLPKPQPSGNFTSRTLDRVSAIRPVSRPLKIRGGWRPWVLGTGWAAAVFVAAVAGYEGGHWLGSRTQPPATRHAVNVQPQLVQDFRVIENRHLYEHADDLDFLRALLDPELFGEEK
jgi:hypothetical protein